MISVSELMTGIWWVFANVAGLVFVIVWFRFLTGRSVIHRELAGAFVLKAAGGLALFAAVAGWLVNAVDLPGFATSMGSLRVYAIRALLALVFVLTGWWMDRFWKRREREIAAERRALWAPPPPPADNSAAERAEAGRFSREAEKLLRAGGWYPGLRTDFQLRAFEFELHERAREFVREFSRVDFGEGMEMYVDPKLANREYANFDAVAKAGLRNCVPLCGSYWHGEASIWMDEDGALYLGGSEQFDLIASTTDEGIECVLLHKPLPGPQWAVEWVG